MDAEQVRDWCAHPGTTVTVKPVVDLAEHIHVNQYEVPDRLAAQTEHRDLTCVFPWCTRPAEALRQGPRHPLRRGRATASDNLGNLCRRHHRLKTHHPGWGYTMLEPGSYLWSSPHGYQFLRDHTGTTDVTHDRTSTRPTGSDTAPHPAPAPPRGATGCRSGRRTTSPPSLRARESAAAGAPVTLLAGSVKGGVAGRSLAQRRRRDTASSATAGGGRGRGASPRRRRRSPQTSVL